ncbi:MAG: penicillin-binding transpeptidase domain-containing protein [Polyangiaceae bacterium]
MFRHPRSLIGLALLIGCSSQSLPPPKDCPEAPPTKPVPISDTVCMDLGGLEQEPFWPAGRGALVDRRGERLSSNPASETPSSLRPWLGEADGSTGLGARFNSPLSRGEDVKLSLDATLHRALEEAFVGVEKGAGVVLDARNGSLLALYSTQLHNTASELERRHWATSWPAPCGSTMKPFTALAALSAGVADETTKYDCDGGLKVGKLEFRCWGKHGPSDLGRALAISDNIFFFQLARLLKHDDIAKTQRAFGFGQPVGLFPRAPAGWTPTEAELRDQGQKLSTGITLSQAIGHGPVAVTPLQVALAYAALATGALPKASLDPSGGASIPVDPKLARFLPSIRNGLRRAVVDAEGTAHVAGPAPDLAGKTGTAEATSSPAMHDPPPSGWFAGWAPVDAPRIAFAFRIEGQSGGEVARRIMQTLAGAANP